MAQPIDWQSVAALVDPFYAAAKGEPAWPPLAIFKALLLSIWHNLSDVKLAEALQDRASFRRFCGFSGTEAKPERTAFVRFRKLLVADGLDGSLFDAVTAQLKAKAVTVKTGTLVDNTIMSSASEEDGDGRWVKHKGRRAVHGFKAHVGANADMALVERISATSAHVNDRRASPAALPDDPGDAFAHSVWARTDEEAQAWLRAWNQPIHRVCGRIEKIFGTWKRGYGLRRMRWQDIAIAYNLKRTLSIVNAAAASQQTEYGRRASTLHRPEPLTIILKSMLYTYPRTGLLKRGRPPICVRAS